MGLASIPPIDRAEFFASLRYYLEKAYSERRGRCQSSVGVIVLDIVDFKRINHTFSYSHGDGVLYLLGERLHTLLAAEDCLHRIGSDEFALIYPRLDDTTLSLQAAAVLQVLQAPFEWLGQSMSVDVVMGCLCHNGEPVSGDILLGEAERLLFRARLEGISFCCDSVFTGEDGGDSWRLESDIVDALQNNELELYFQPQLHLASGLPLRAEGVLYWQHPSRGKVSAQHLLAVLTRLRRELELTKWMLHTALRQLQGWPALERSQLMKSSAGGLHEALPPIGVAVKIPAPVVHHPDLHLLVKDALAIWNVEPRRLTLEISEIAIIEDRQAGIGNLACLKEIGVNLSIGNFGSGYFSLASFKDAPVSEIKIDRSFVSHMQSSTDDRHLVELFVDLAQRFGLRVVAEGVENKETLAALKKHHCDSVQGTYISAPMPADQYSRWLVQFSAMN